MVDDEIPAGEPVWVGLDLGWKHDTTAAVPLWVRDPEYRLLGPTAIVVPPRNGNTMMPTIHDTFLAPLMAWLPKRSPNTLNTSMIQVTNKKNMMNDRKTCPTPKLAIMATPEAYVTVESAS
jgi:hypothetical protein